MHDARKLPLCAISSPDALTETRMGANFPSGPNFPV